MSVVHAAIARHFPAPEYVVLYEVRDDAGLRAQRSADAVAMSVWPSRGLSVHGVEVKVQRSDFLRELRNPEKSAPIQRYCDYWWIATSDESVAQVEQIPETWGLLVLRGGKLAVAKPAPKLESEPLTRGFVAMLLRSATHDVVAKASVNELVEERLETRVRALRDDAALRADRLQRELSDLRGKVDAFEKASGIAIGDRDRFTHGALGDPAKVGAAVRSIVSADRWLSTQGLQGAKNMINVASQEIGDAIEALRALKETP